MDPIHAGPFLTSTLLIVLPTMRRQPFRRPGSSPLPGRRLSLRRRVLFRAGNVRVAFRCHCGRRNRLAASPAMAELHESDGPFFVLDGETGYHGKPNFTGRFRRGEINVTVEHDENGFRAARKPARRFPRSLRTGRLLHLGLWHWPGELLTKPNGATAGPPRPQFRPDRRGHGPGVADFPKARRRRHLSGRAIRSCSPSSATILATMSASILRAASTPRSPADRYRLVPPPPPSTTQRWKNWLKDSSCLFNLAAYFVDRLRMIGTKNLFDRAGRRVLSPKRSGPTRATAAPRCKSRGITWPCCGRWARRARSSRCSCRARPSSARTT